MMTTSQLGDLNRWKRLRIAGTPLYKGLLMSHMPLISYLATFKARVEVIKVLGTNQASTTQL